MGKQINQRESLATLAYARSEYCRVQLKHHNLPKGFSSQWIYFSVLVQMQYAKFQNKYVVNLQQKHISQKLRALYFTAETFKL